MHIQAKVLVPALLLVVISVASAVVVSAAAEERPARESREERIPGQYIVVFKDSVTDPEALEEDMITRTRSGRIHSYRHALSGFSATLNDEALRELQQDPRVAFISEDRAVSIDRTRNSETVTATAVQTLPTGINRINAEALSNKGTGVHVAVLDTGIQTDHPDLKNNIAGGKNCAPGIGYKDQNGHGTHVAGTIAAAHNTQGVVGVAPAAKLWAVRVLDRYGSGSWSSIICGLDFVASKGPLRGGPIKVANLSLSGGGTNDNNCGNTNNDALHKAICRARDAGVTIVVAAGNSASNTANSVPAAYDDAVITVSALTDSDGVDGGLGSSTSYGLDDTFASFSNYGSAVDIGAPGVNIYSTWINKGYRAISGTSMASPHVAGAAALYLAANPSANWLTVRNALVGMGEPLGSGHTDPSLQHSEPVLRADSL